MPPHGKCLPCPGGPDHPFGSPQSYTGGEEPAALRGGRQYAFDPYVQVRQRLLQFELLGHHIDKVELIVMGGTMTARDPVYQESFMGSCIRAMNEYGGDILPDDAPPRMRSCVAGTRPPGHAVLPQHSRRVRTGVNRNTSTVCSP